MKNKKERTVKAMRIIGIVGVPLTMLSTFIFAYRLNKKVDAIKYVTDECYIPVTSIERWIDSHFDDYYPGD